MTLSEMIWNHLIVPRNLCSHTISTFLPKRTKKIFVMDDKPRHLCLHSFQRNALKDRTNTTRTPDSLLLHYDQNSLHNTVDCSGDCDHDMISFFTKISGIKIPLHPAFLYLFLSTEISPYCLLLSFFGFKTSQTNTT